MTPTYLCYNGDVANGVNPFRPGIDSVGGAAKLDDQAFPPDPITMPTAADENQAEMLLVAYGKVTCAAWIYVKFSAGTPSIFAVRAAGTLLQASDFTITDNGNGDTTLQCPATKIPQPLAALPFPQTNTDIRAAGVVTGTSDGLRIVTKNGSAVNTDCDFVVGWL